jgi:hypothetical protein
MPDTMSTYTIVPTDGQIVNDEFFCGPCARWVPVSARATHNRTLHQRTAARFTARDPQYALASCGECRFGTHRCVGAVKFNIAGVAGTYRCQCGTCAAIGPAS